MVESVEIMYKGNGNIVILKFCADRVSEGSESPSVVHYSSAQSRRSRRIFSLRGPLVRNGQRSQFLQLENLLKTWLSSRSESRVYSLITHQLFGKVGLSYPLPIRDPVHHQSSSNHFHVHSIPSSFSNHNTTSSPHSSNHTPTRSAPLSRSPSATPSVLCSCDSPLRSRRRPKSSHATHQTL